MFFWGGNVHNDWQIHRQPSSSSSGSSFQGAENQRLRPSIDEKRSKSFVSKGYRRWATKNQHLSIFIPKQWRCLNGSFSSVSIKMVLSPVCCGWKFTDLHPLHLHPFIQLHPICPCQFKSSGFTSSSKSGFNFLLGFGVDSLLFTSPFSPWCHWRKWGKSSQVTIASTRTGGPQPPFCWKVNI